jgi:hypothetical protein
MPYTPKKTIDEAEADWAKHAKAKADSWAKNVASDVAYKRYTSHIAGFLGVPEDTVARSLPAVGYRAFQGRASRLIDNFKSGIDEAAAAKRWSTKYKEAFTTPAPP